MGFDIHPNIGQHHDPIDCAKCFRGPGAASAEGFPGIQQTRIEDVDKARVMAEAEDPHREKAAEYTKRSASFDNSTFSREQMKRSLEHGAESELSRSRSAAMMAETNYDIEQKLDPKTKELKAEAEAIRSRAKDLGLDEHDPKVQEQLRGLVSESPSATEPSIVGANEESISPAELEQQRTEAQTMFLEGLEKMAELAGEDPQTYFENLVKERSKTSAYAASGQEKAIPPESTTEHEVSAEKSVAQLADEAWAFLGSLGRKGGAESYYFGTAGHEIKSPKFEHAGRTWILKATQDHIYDLKSAQFLVIDPRSISTAEHQVTIPKHRLGKSAHGSYWEAAAVIVPAREAEPLSIEEGGIKLSIYKGEETITGLDPSNKEALDKNQTLTKFTELLAAAKKAILERGQEEGK